MKQDFDVDFRWRTVSNYKGLGWRLIIGSFVFQGSWEFPTAPACRKKRLMALLLVGVAEKSDWLIGRDWLQGLFLIHLDTAASIFEGIHVWQSPPSQSSIRYAWGTLTVFSQVTLHLFSHSAFFFPIPLVYLIGEIFLTQKLCRSLKSFTPRRSRGRQFENEAFW